MKEVSYSDSELILMISRGSDSREKAIRILMGQELREKRLSKHLHRLGANSMECEEIVNDAFVALIASVQQGRFKEGGSVWGYLYGAARNILWKLRRKSNPDVSLDLDVPLQDNEESVETKIIKGERREWLLRVLSSLSEKCHRILSLAFFEEKSNDEIADILGYKSREVVGVKKSECLKRLATMIKSTPGPL